MLFIIHKILATIIATCWLLSIPTVLASEWWEYQNRGDRWEGIAPRPVSGLDIELLSALVDYRENKQSTPSWCQLQFYLPHTREIDLRVQELRPKKFYKMDKVIPKSHWKQGLNHYKWPFTDVLEPLGLKIPKLGVLARFKTPAYTDTEHVVPVIFYHSTPPSRIEGYLFAFKVGGSAELKYAIYQGKNDTPLITENLGRQYAGEPFIIYWKSAGAKKGIYELIVDGEFLNDYTPIRQAVQFYHYPLTKRTN